MRHTVSTDCYFLSLNSLLYCGPINDTPSMLRLNDSPPATYRYSHITISFTGTCSPPHGPPTSDGTGQHVDSRACQGRTFGFSLSTVSHRSLPCGSPIFVSAIFGFG